MLAQISILDWVMLAISAVSVGIAYLRGLNRLSPSARNWLGEIGEPLIRDIIEQSAQMVQLTGEQRRARAAEILQDAALSRVGIDLPSSIANYLIEHVYQSVKGRIRI